MYRALKPERWLSLVFAHREVELWELVLAAIAEAGFRFQNAVAIPSRLV